MLERPMVHGLAVIKLYANPKREFLLCPWLEDERKGFPAMEIGIDRWEGNGSITINV
jgi:hypothetical protein